jgi:opacity protein-like surface antigen
MKTNRFPLRSVVLWAASLSVLLPASAQFPNYFAPGGGDRAGKWDGYVVLGGSSPQGLDYQDIDVSGLDTSVSIDTHVQGGVGIGYNLNQFWNVNFEMVFGAPDFHVTAPGLPGTRSDTVYQGNGKLNLDWNILPSRITPLVSAGIGFVTLTVNDPSQSVDCYPDYWWGYVCYESTQTEAAFTWNVGGGLRVDITSRVFLKAVAGVEWWLLSQTENLPYSIFGNLSVGMSFR